MKDNNIAKWLEEEYPRGGQENLELERVLKTVDSFEEPRTDASVLLSRIKEEIDLEQGSRNYKRYIVWSLIALAISLLLGYLIYSNQSNQNIITAQHLIEQTILPDGSLVTLNRNSQLKYASSFNDNRILELDGEAFFEVKKGSTFSVQTKNGIVTVLGTSFNVWSRDNTFEVTCKTGKVSVEGSGEKVVLTPGKRARLNRGLFQLDNCSVDKIDTWSQGSESHFDSVPIAQVIASLASHYGLEISIADNIDPSSKFTGSYLHDNKELALKMVLTPMNLKSHTAKGNRILVSSK